MIYIKDKLFRALDTEPYARALDAIGWQHIGSEYVTKEIDLLLPFLKYLSPEVQALLNPPEPEGPFDVELKEGAKPLFDFQIEDVKFILSRTHTLLAEDAGLGKTAIMLTAMNSLQARRVLIVTPAVAKYNWLMKEIPKWYNLGDRTVHVVEANDWKDSNIIIINYDLLVRHKARIQAVNWDVLICDESHRLNNKDAKRTRMVVGGKMKLKKETAVEIGGRPDKAPGFYWFEKIKAKRWIWATATPMDRPKNMWVVCQTMDPKGLGSDWFAFHKRYCAAFRGRFGWDINGADNLQELGARLRDSFMVRHENPIELPPFREQVFLMPPVQIVLDAEEGFVQDNMDALLSLAEKSGKTLDKDASVADFMRLIGDSLIDNVHLIGKPEFAPLFTKFSQIREKTGLAKVPYVVEFIKDKTNDGEYPMVCFCYHRSVMAKLREAFPDAAYVVGGMPSEKRNEMVDRFQNGETNIFLGNIDAAGEAITLTRSRQACFAEMDWRGRSMIQARKRVHRITQEHPVSVDYLCAAMSFDAYVSERAVEKMKNIKEVIETHATCNDASA